MYHIKVSWLVANIIEALCEAYGDLIAFCATACGVFMNEEGQMSSKFGSHIAFVRC